MVITKRPKEQFFGIERQVRDTSVDPNRAIFDRSDAIKFGTRDRDRISHYINGY